jgi:hypothetical protein
MSQIMAYSYSEGPAGSAGVAAGATALHAATNTLAVVEQTSAGTTTYARTAAPSLFDAQLTTWAANLTSAAPWGAPAGQYAFTYSSATQRVTLASTNSTSFRPIMVGNVASWLGFTQTINPATYATSWTGESAPAGVLELLGVGLEPPEAADDTEVLSLRHGRNYVPLFGNHQVQKPELLAQRSRLPPDLSYLLTGRVRITPMADTAAYDAVAHLGGYIDGYVTEEPAYGEPDPDSDIIEITLTLAVAR